MSISIKQKSAPLEKIERDACVYIQKNLSGEWAQKGDYNKYVTQYIWELPIFGELPRDETSCFTINIQLIIFFVKFFENYCIIYIGSRNSN